MTPDTERLGFTEDSLPVTVSADNADKPGLVADILISKGDSLSAVIEWEPPKDGKSLVHGYEVRYRLRGGGSEETVTLKVYPRQTMRICGTAGPCENPRRLVITQFSDGTKLAAGTTYNLKVWVKAINANGSGNEWSAGKAFIPNP